MKKISRRDFLLIILSLGIGAIISSLFYFTKEKEKKIF
jgi:hypothetical protein